MYSLKAALHTLENGRFRVSVLSFAPAQNSEIIIFHLCSHPVTPPTVWILTPRNMPRARATTTAFIYVRKLGDNDMKFKYRRDATTVSAEDYLYAPSCEEESDELFKRFSTLRAIR